MTSWCTLPLNCRVFRKAPSASTVFAAAIAPTLKPKEQRSQREELCLVDLEIDHWLNKASMVGWVK